MNIIQILPWLIPIAIAGAVTFYFLRRRRSAGVDTILPNPLSIGPRPVGINLTEHTFFSPEFVFKDVFKSNSGWAYLPVEMEAGMSYRALEAMPTDDNKVFAHRSL